MGRGDGAVGGNSRAAKSEGQFAAGRRRKRRLAQAQVRQTADATRGWRRSNRAGRGGAGRGLRLLAGRCPFLLAGREGIRGKGGPRGREAKH